MSRSPGWYRDPEHALRHRYWDGERWLAQHERISGARSGEHDLDDQDDQDDRSA